MVYSEEVIKVSIWRKNPNLCRYFFQKLRPAQFVPTLKWKIPNSIQFQTIRNCVTGEYSCLKVDLLFKREFSYYLIQIYIPCCMLVIVSWVSFWLDQSAVPARVSLGVTTLLTMATQTSGILWSMFFFFKSTRPGASCGIKSNVSTVTRQRPQCFRHKRLAASSLLHESHRRVDRSLSDVRVRCSVRVRSRQLRVSVRHAPRQHAEAAEAAVRARTRCPAWIRIVGRWWCRLRHGKSS